MNLIINSLKMLLLVSFGHFYAAPTCISFDYSRDMPAVNTLLKKEWSKLFLSPSYDDKLVHKIFYKKQPGDVTVTNTTVTIDVMYTNNHLAGFVTYYLKKHHTGHLELLCVDSAFRNQGYGKLLIEHTIDEVKKHGCTTIQLYVYTSNPKAITFYEHLGFKLKANFGAYILLYKDI